MQLLKRVPPIAILSCIIIVHLIFLTQISFWPYQEFRVYPYLTSQGFIPYKQLIDQHFPGLFFFPINLYTLGLATPLGLRFLQLLIVASTQALIYFTIKKLTRSNSASLFANFLFLVTQPLYEGYVFWVDSFTTPLLLLSFYLLLNVNTKHSLPKKYLFLSGLSLAFSVLFKQPLAAVFVLVLAYLVVTRVNYKGILAFFAGFAIPLIYLLIYIQQLNIWKEFWYWNFTFNETLYPKYFFRLPTHKELFFLLAILIPFSLCSLYLIKKKDKHIVLILAYALPILILLYGTWAFIHLQPFLPFTIITITLFILVWKKQQRLLVIAYTIVMLLLMLIHIHNVGKSTTIGDSHETQLIKVLKQFHTKHKSIYLYNTDAVLYQLSGTIPANRFYVPSYPWYNVLLENKLETSVITSKPDVIIQPVGHSPHSKISSFISSSYKLGKVVDGNQIWLRK